MYPLFLPKSKRRYYQTTWGFDPITDCHPLSNSYFRYEECIPLLQDLPLQTVGVQICARVEWKLTEIRNRIVFRRIDSKGRQREASVECTHTVVYAGPVTDALAFVDDLNESPDNQNPVDEELSDETMGPALLPPWEHFTALKSYVAGIADMGILTLLRQYIKPNSNPSNDLPFGFNAGMHTQVEKALFAIAPRAMLSIYRDFTRELLDTYAPAELGDQRIYWPTSYTGTSNHKQWKYMLRHLDASMLVYWFRHTGIADEFQNHLFTDRILLAEAQAIAPNLPWDSLRLEWEARREAERLDRVTLDHGPTNMKSIPPAEVWARTSFCDYTFPRDILTPDSTSARRSRVQVFLHEMIKTYTERDPTEALGDEYLDKAQSVSSRLEGILAEPFPTDRVRPKPTRHYDPLLKQYASLTPAEVVDGIEHGDHRQRRDLTLCYPIPPELQEKLATHWDFATRLALVGNPGTLPAVIATLAQDHQPCVRLATEARVRRGTTTFEPSFGEMLGPGEMVWLLSSHPGVFFEFGVTTWGDGSEAYRDWLATRLREDGQRRFLLGQLYSWVYSEGIFLEDGERGPHGSHLAYWGLTDHACGQFPCLYLGFNVFNPQYGDIQRLDL